MQKNIFLEIEYIGTNYFGFQIQNKKGKREITVQSAVEKALARLFGQKIRITFAGRTDKGVHAKGQVVNFKVNTKIPLKSIKKALNAFLPSAIRVKKIKRVPWDYHSRFWAKSKIYRYIINNKKEPSVFWKDFSWHISDFLDIESMQRASRSLIGKKDFSLFAKGAREYRNCIRILKNISIKKRGGFIYIDIEADGFLRNMARNIVSFLVKIGRGKIAPEEIKPLLQGDIPYINKPAPAQGLYLYKVKY